VEQKGAAAAKMPEEELADAVAGGPSDEVREIFTLKSLKERVWRMEAENKELKVNNNILNTQYTSQCETQSDILRTLHANLDENYSKIEELENRIHGPLGYEQQLEDAKQAAKDELESQKTQWEARVAELQMKNEYLDTELHSVAEFREKRGEMEVELTMLRQQLKDQAAQHAKDVSAFDRKKAIEIDQLKKDMHRSIKETREMLKNRTKDQLDTTTKRTIMENEQMATELHFQSKQTEQLLERNQALIEENAQLRRNLVIHKDLENELARRTHVYQKLIKKMHQRQKPDSVADGDADRGLDSVAEASQGDHNQASSLGASRADAQASAALQEENERLQRQLEGIQSTLQMVRHEFAQYRRDHATLTQLQDHSTRLIIATLYELKNQRECDPFPPASYDEHASWQFTNMTAKQKEYFFRVLLEKLNSSMCGSCFPTGANPSQQLTGAVSASSLPALVGKGDACKTHDHQASTGGAAHFSQFLWSVASHGAAHKSIETKHVESKGCQTETDASDPCFKDGVWNPNSRSRHGDAGPVTPAMVIGNVRSWNTTAPTSEKKSRRAAGRAM